jgi:hypothetical protein
MQSGLLVCSPGETEQMTGKIGVDAPVLHLIRCLLGAAGTLAADAHMIEFVVMCQKTGFDDPHAFSSRGQT